MKQPLLSLAENMKEKTSQLVQVYQRAFDVVVRYLLQHHNLSA